MVLEQVQKNLKHDWWSDVAVVGGSVLHPMYPYPCSKKVTRTNTRITKLLTVECGLAAGCFVTISSPPPIYNLDASCFLLTHPRFIPPLVLNWRLEWTKQQQLHVTSEISEQFLVYHSSTGVWM